MNLAFLGYYGCGGQYSHPAYPKSLYFNLYHPRLANKSNTDAENATPDPDCMIDFSFDCTMLRQAASYQPKDSFDQYTDCNISILLNI